LNVLLSTGTDEGLSGLWLIGGLLSFSLWPLLMENFYRRLSNWQKRLSYEINSELILVRDGIGSVVGFPWSVVRSMTETMGFSITL
jgi:hypothetical protein